MENIENMETNQVETQQYEEYNTPETQTIPEEPVVEQEYVAEDSQVSVEPEKKDFKKLLMIGVAALAALLVLIVAIVVVGKINNNYKTPVKLMISYTNKKETKDPVKASMKMMNGFAEDELSKIIKILKKSENYEDIVEEMEESTEYMVEYFEELYGEDYKFSYKIEEKEKLDKDDLKEVKDSFKNAAKSMKEFIDETEDFDSDDWSDLADEMGLSKSEAKKLVKAYKALYSELKSVKVTKGYELEYTVIIEGEELDEPEENDATLEVYKVNGRWISMQNLSLLEEFVG